jgi:hypothetical protein
MNRFRKLGFIDYEGGSGLQVHSSLLNIGLDLPWAITTLAGSLFVFFLAIVPAM